MLENSKILSLSLSLADSFFNFLLIIEFCKVMKLTILHQNDFSLHVKSFEVFGNCTLKIQENYCYLF